MSDQAGTAAPKPSSSVKLVLLGEAAVGKVSQYSTRSCHGRCEMDTRAATDRAPPVIPRAALRER